ncbi:MAG: helix-turn-helix domain-containing protein [Burkholderia gladioli]
MLEHMPATPQQHAILGVYAARLEHADHRTRGDTMAELAKRLGVTPRTAYRWLEDHLPRDRKQRSDAGKLALTSEEAQYLSAAMLHGYRQNGNRILKFSNSRT